MKYKLFGSYQQCAGDLNRVDDFRENSNEFKLHMWYLRISRICMWLRAEICIGRCRDSWYFYIILDSTFQYQRG